MEEFSEFKVSPLELRDGRATISVEGELDLYSSPELKAQLAALPNDLQHLVLDLTGLTFIDSAGLAVLVFAARKLRGRGGSVRLTIGDHDILKVMAITGFDRYFEIARPV
jgi:anti-sigma B factor antagonist